MKTRQGWKFSRYQPDHFTNSPWWDYKLCRCENNGDYCEYCNKIELQVDEFLEKDKQSWPTILNIQ
jgi:hypothetical protein